MKLWTIRDKSDLDLLNKTGRFYTKRPQHLEDPLGFQWRMAYAWMTLEMRKRIGPPPRGVKWPCWAWFQYEDADSRRPDLRHVSQFNYPGSALIELEIEDSKVLLSDFDLWHFPLNYWYLCSGKKDEEQFDKKIDSLVGKNQIGGIKPLPKELHLEIVKSWDKIFEMKKFTRSKYISANAFEKKSIQATFWEFSKDDIISIKYFGSKKD